MEKQVDICPHCGKKMSKWLAAAENSWGPTPQYVCFNNDCPYYIKGWEWMQSQYGQKCSYRHRYNVETGDSGPLPVFSDDALRSGIVDE